MLFFCGRPSAICEPWDLGLEPPNFAIRECTFGMIKAAYENVLFLGAIEDQGHQSPRRFPLPLLHICKKRLRILLDFLLGSWIVL